jgi:uncharacterized membrane protein HdeD (DUF308 family)
MAGTTPRWITTAAHRISNATKPGWTPYIFAGAILVVAGWLLTGNW